MCQKTIVACCFFLLSSWPSVLLSQERLTGHVWREMPKEIKVPLIKGFTTGYELGKQGGYLSGSFYGVEWLESKICKEETEATCAKIKETTKKSNRERFMLGLGGMSSFKGTTEHYMSEVDAFYEAFPLCRGEDFFLIVGQLILVWDGHGDASYKKFGTDCGEKKR